MARLAAQPSVAYWERGVASAVMAILGEIESGISPERPGIEVDQDSYGNIIARLPGGDSSVEPLALVAHMDHPGFEAIVVGDDGLVAKALGGVPAAGFEPGVPLQLVLSDGTRLPGLTRGRHGEESERQIMIQLAEATRIDFPLELPCPVVFDLPDFKVDGDFIRMRAADDLAGCACILASLEELRRGPPGEIPPGDVYGVFTRAEEVGLVGARLLAESRGLPPETLVVSLESSRALPGAEQGGGPVIRVGDAALTFNAEAEAVLVKAREVLQSRPEGFRCQRQLMSGGVCEASAFGMHGYQATGVAFPLGNYHNGSPAGTVEAEYIYVDDYLGGIQLIVEAARQVAARGSTGYRQRLGQVPEDMAQRLRETAG